MEDDEICVICRKAHNPPFDLQVVSHFGTQGAVWGSITPNTKKDDACVSVKIFTSRAYAAEKIKKHWRGKPEVFIKPLTEIIELMKAAKKTKGLT